MTAMEPVSAERVLPRVGLAVRGSEGLTPKLPSLEGRIP